MFRNYLKIAVRNIGRRKGYSFIKISGLALGMAICILIMLWAYNESQLRTNVQVTDDMTNIYLLSTMAVIILLMACFNFINLTTAQGPERSKEIGIRKVVGAQRTGIIKQFLSESFLLAFFALFLAAILVELLLPEFSRLTGKQLTSTWLGNPYILTGMIVVTMAAGIMAGSYPALFLSSFQPAKILKSQLKPGKKGGLSRKVLVMIQFSLAVIFLVGSIVMFQQQDYINTLADNFPGGIYIEGKRITMIFIYLSLLAIFIASQGLYGLSVFLAEQRGREMGIRKVFGASWVDVWRLFTYQFMKWIITANLLAWPIAHFLLKHLLIQGITDRIHIGPWPFVMSGIMTSFIALLTVAFQTFKAATASPSVTLRCE
jgi:predicted lysophospholipase L1 biosynthesis ABC-type transport system permease subunit